MPIEEPWEPLSESFEQRMGRLRRERREAAVYCPVCGEVAQGRKRWLKAGQWYVPDHGRWTGENWGEYVRCPGGDIDIEKDRAP
jgi:hypothetical protein